MPISRPMMTSLSDPDWYCVNRSPGLWGRHLYQIANVEHRGHWVAVQCGEGNLRNAADASGELFIESFAEVTNTHLAWSLRADGTACVTQGKLTAEIPAALARETLAAFNRLTADGVLTGGEIDQLLALEDHTEAALKKLGTTLRDAKVGATLATAPEWDQLAAEARKITGQSFTAPSGQGCPL